VIRFSVNISILFREVPFVERFALVRDAGFTAVEFWWPTGEDLRAVEGAALASGLAVVGINFDAGDMAAGDRGLAADPAREARFRENVPVALELARRLGCRQLNALVGLQIEGLEREEQLETARRNVAFAADRAAEQGATVLIEAINTFENGPYLLRTTREAADFVRRVGRENVRLQYDVYHMQRMEGNLVATIREHIHEIAHVQVADSPDRGEPGTGEINFTYLFRELEGLGYRGWVGLEYRPSTGVTTESFGWVPREARDVPTEAGVLNVQPG
jgi:hydroxypyruvate isomerase